MRAVLIYLDGTLAFDDVPERHRGGHYEKIDRPVRAANALAWDEPMRSRVFQWRGQIARPGRFEPRILFDFFEEVE